MAQLFRITGCEASLDSYYQTGLVHQCSPTEIHAMYLYCALKRLTRQDGHIYVKIGRLEREALAVRTKYRPSSQGRDGIRSATLDWSEALHFLEHWRVIVRENDGMHVFLHRHWNAETKIAEAFHTLRKWHQVQPWTLEIDAEQYVYLHLAVSL